MQIASALPSEIMLIIGGIVIFFSVIWLTALSMQIVKLRKQVEQSQESLRGMRKQLKLLLHADVGLGHQVQKITRHYELLEERQENAEHQPQQAAYNHAMKLLELGSDLDSVVQASGISYAEARLLASLRRNNVKQQPSVANTF
ncbi:MAG: hypothetical protein Tsb005_07570 [Gammaproteobacteria bacterium]